jgi:hypothetical protein
VAQGGEEGSGGWAAAQGREASFKAVECAPGEPPREGGMSLPGRRLDLGSWRAAAGPGQLAGGCGVGGRHRRL